MIDTSSGVPIYYQLKNLIENHIRSGEFQPGDKLPTEAEWCERFNISRAPVRQALLELTHEGLLTRKAGRGTFVADVIKDVITLHATIPDKRWQWSLEEATRNWNEANANQPLSVEFEIVPLTELHDWLSWAVAEGRAPDISIVDTVWVAEFAQRRYLYALAELDPAWAKEIQHFFYPSILNANRYRQLQYTLPTNVDATVLWYRRDWFEREGLNPPTTWDELIEVGQHFKDYAVRERYGLSQYPLTFAAGRMAGETTTYQLLPLLWSSGGDIIRNDTVVIDSDATYHMLTFLDRLVHSEEMASPEVVYQTWNGPLQAFARGEVALAFGGTYENYLIQSAADWDLSTFNELVGFIPLPAGPGRRSITLVGGMTYGIFRQSRHPQAALNLLKQLLAPQVLKPFSLQTGQHSAHVGIAQSIRPEEDGYLRRTTSLFEKARSRPPLVTYSQVSAQFQELIEWCLTHEFSIEAAMHRASERISGITGLPIA